MKVAYIEDDQDARQIFAGRLCEDGYECRTFDHAESFLENVSAGDFDVVISDIQLPGKNGVELIRTLRERQVLVPCILITAFNSLEYARSALNASANYLLEKPFSYEDLLSVIQKVTGGALTVEHCVQRGLAAMDLTEREGEIAQLLLKGLNNQEIAKIASLSEKTVKQHITQIFQKSGVTSRAEFFSSIFPT